MAKYLNPYTDFGFKKLFGEEANKDLLADFLNQLLPANHQIERLEFRNPENLADVTGERKAIFDIYCESPKGERFIVEMQKARAKFFKDRSLFYVSYPIREQSRTGDEWDFRLTPIYFIAVLDFCYEKSDSGKLLRNVCLKDQDGETFYDKLHFSFLQMPLFDKSQAQLQTRFDKWCYLLKNLENLDNIPSIMNEPIFQRAFTTAELANLSQSELSLYQQSRRYYSSLKPFIDTAIEEALEAAEAEKQAALEAAEGEKQAALEAAEAEKQAALEAEKRQNAENTARKALSIGLDVATAAHLSGLSLEEVEALKA